MPRPSKGYEEGCQTAVAETLFHLAAVVLVVHTNSVPAESM
jgi:hypothetical protein